MKLYVSNLESHICLDDEEKTITTITSSSYLDSCAIAHTKDAGAFYGLSDIIIKTMSGSNGPSINAPTFLPDTEENFNEIKEKVFARLNNL